MTLGNGKTPHWWEPESWKLRDICLFLVGLGGLTNEALLREVPRDKLVGLFVLMMLGPTYVQPVIDFVTKTLGRK